MSVDIQGTVNDVRVSAIHSDPKLGTWWAFGTDRMVYDAKQRLAQLNKDGGGDE